ncbi:MAG: hypothetical protein HQ567_09350 [Candidatus Nealsonbacteria bacterium]|nr:hypothetical protein [Candidatus Nealsonbacteria bacterium]
MHAPRQLFTASLLASCVLTAFVTDSLAQADSKGWVAKGSIAKANWQQRALTSGRTDRSNAFDDVFSDAKPTHQTARRPSQQPAQPVSTIAEAEQEAAFAADELIPTPDPTPAGDEAYDPLSDFEFSEAQSSASYGNEQVFGGGCGGCGECDECGECGGEPGCGWYGGPHYGFLPGLVALLGQARCTWWARDMVFTSGVHGFKGPTDLGRNGNFGAHMGLNMGAPLGGFPEVGYQVGFLAVRSNLSGDQVTNNVRTDDRDQYFATVGLFRRSRHGGLQWAVAFDVLRDRYFSQASLKQLRTETGFLWPGGRHEIGYFGAYGIDSDEITFNVGAVQNRRLLDPTDMFALYYRRHFDAGGEGRFWTGVTGKGDTILGADLVVPLGRNWSVENRMNYLIPKESRGAAGLSEESWGLTMHLVFHLGQPARAGLQSPYRPILGVADNTLFMSDVSVP